MNLQPYQNNPLFQERQQQFMHQQQFPMQPPQNQSLGNTQFELQGSSHENLLSYNAQNPNNVQQNLQPQNMNVQRQNNEQLRQPQIQQQINQGNNNLNFPVDPESKKKVDDSLKKIEELIEWCNSGKQGSSQNQGNSEKEKITELLNRMSEVPTYVRYKEIRDGWLKRDLSIEEYMNQIQSAFGLQGARQYAQRIKDGRIKEDKNNLFSLTNLMEYIKMVLQKGISDGSNAAQGIKDLQKMANLDYEAYVFNKKLQSNSYDVETLGNFIFQKKSNSILPMNRNVRFRDAKLLESGGFKVSSKKSPNGFFTLLWQNPVLFKLEKQTKDDMNNSSLQESKRDSVILDPRKQQQENNNAIKRSQSKDEQKRLKKQKESAKWTQEFQHRILIKPSIDHEDNYYIYLPDQIAMKVMDFLRYKNMVNQKDEKRKYTVKGLFNICANLYKIAVRSSWYSNYLKEKKKKIDKAKQFIEKSQEKKKEDDRRIETNIENNYKNENTSSFQNDNNRIQMPKENQSSIHVLLSKNGGSVSIEEKDDQNKISQQMAASNSSQSPLGQSQNSLQINQQQSLNQIQQKPQPDRPKNQQEFLMQTQITIKEPNQQKSQQSSSQNFLPQQQKQNWLSISDKKSHNQFEIKETQQSMKQQQKSADQENVMEILIEDNQGVMNPIHLREKCALLIEMEIISTNSPPPKLMYIQYSYVYFKENKMTKCLGKLHNYKQELKQIEYIEESRRTRYVLKDKFPIMLSDETIKGNEDSNDTKSKTQFSLEIEIFNEKERKLLGACYLNYDKFLLNSSASDFWLFTYLKDVRENQQQSHFCFLHLSCYDRQNLSYLDQYQSIVKNDLTVKCPRYQEIINLPTFVPEDILIVYGILEIFDFEEQFLGFHKYGEIKENYSAILKEGEDQQSLPIQERKKTYSEYCANIRTFYSYLYLCSIQKLMITQRIQEEIWFKFEENLQQHNENDLNQNLYSNFQGMCIDGIPLDNRFPTWFELSLLVEYITKVFEGLDKFAKNPEIDSINRGLAQLTVKAFDRQEYKRNLKLDDKYNYDALEKSIEDRCKRDGVTQEQVLKEFGIFSDISSKDKKNDIFKKKKDLYGIIQQHSTSKNIWIIQPFYHDINQYTDSNYLLNKRIPWIGQLIKDFFFTDNLLTARKLQDTLKNNRKSGSAAIYHKSLIPIFDALFSLNSISSRAEQKLSLSEIYWGFFTLYRNILKQYLCTKHQGKILINNLFIINYALKTYLQELWNHLDGMNLSVDFIFENALLSLFSNLFHKELLFRLWDLLYLEVSRLKIKPTWVLVAAALTILSNTNDILLICNKQQQVYDVIKYYCQFDVNIDSFISQIYEWIDKLFYNPKEQVFKDDNFRQKIIIQQNTMELFHIKYFAANIYFNSEIISQFPEFQFNSLFVLYNQLHFNFNEVQEQMYLEEQVEIHPLFEVKMNEPKEIHIMLHSFSSQLQENQYVVITYDQGGSQDLDSCDSQYVSFRIDNYNLRQTQLIGNLTIKIQQKNLNNKDPFQRHNEKSFFEGMIKLDNLYIDQVVKLQLCMLECTLNSQNQQKIHKPQEYTLECSVLIQSNNIFNLRYSQTRRVSYHFFKNTDNKINSNTTDIVYVNGKYGNYSPLNSNILFYRDLNQSNLKQKIDIFNVNMLTQWKLNSQITLFQVSNFVTDLFPDISISNRTQLIKIFADLDGQFYLLDLLLLFLIYSQESLPNKVSLLFKFLVFFERRQSSDTLLDVTVKSFLVAFYERMEYFIPSHQVLAAEQQFRFKSVSQINQIIYIANTGERSEQMIEISLTALLKSEYLDVVFSKNLIQNIDLNNPDLLQIIYNILWTEKKLFNGRLEVHYIQQTHIRMKSIELVIDSQNETLVLNTKLQQRNKRLLQSQDKKNSLIQQLLERQSHTINFEYYETYNEQQFYDLLNNMVCLPILFTATNMYRDNPLDGYKEKLSLNLNLQLIIRLQIDEERKEKLVYYVRDEFFSERFNFIKAQEGNIPEEHKLYVPNINIYCRLEQLIEEILNTLTKKQILTETQSSYAFEVYEQEFSNEKKLKSVNECQKLNTQLTLENIFSDLQKLDRQIILNEISEKIEKFELELLIKINTNQKRSTQQQIQQSSKQKTVTYAQFQSVNQQETLLQFRPVNIISPIQEQQQQQQYFLVQSEQFPNKYFIIYQFDLKNSLIPKISHPFVQKFVSYQEYFDQKSKKSSKAQKLEPGANVVNSSNRNSYINPQLISSMQPSLPLTSTKK